MFEMSSMLAVSAASKLPDGVRWLSASAKSAASRTGHVFGAALLEAISSKTLADIREIGFIRFTGRQMRPSTCRRRSCSFRRRVESHAAPRRPLEEPAGSRTPVIGRSRASAHVSHSADDRSANTRARASRSSG